MAAIVAMAICCSLTLVATAGGLAVLGGWLRNPCVIAAAIVVLISVGVIIAKRLRSGYTESRCQPSGDRPIGDDLIDGAP